MKIDEIHIHYFRSIKDVIIRLTDYTVLIGANNVGKSNIITSIRAFYGDYKFNHERDFPKFRTKDRDSYIDVTFKLASEEWETLPEKYKLPKGRLKIRRYFRSENESFSIKRNQSNMYGLISEKELDESTFFGARNVGEGKLGRVIYIPDVTTIGDTLKLTGPSPMRRTLNYVIEKVIKKSTSFEELRRTF